MVALGSRSARASATTNNLASREHVELMTDSDDPTTVYLREHGMYPGGYVKDVAQKLVKGLLKLPSKRWLWLRFEYGMLQHPITRSILIPFDKVNAEALLSGTYVSEREKSNTRFWLWLTLITFQFYTKLPRTQYQAWKRQRDKAAIWQKYVDLLRLKSRKP